MIMSHLNRILPSTIFYEQSLVNSKIIVNMEPSRQERLLKGRCSKIAKSCLRVA